MPLRALLHAVAVVVGAASGVIGSFAHGRTAHGVPVGLLAGLGLTYAVLLTAGLATGSRSGPLAAAAGWFATVLVLATRRPEGDLVVPATTLGYAWLFGGALAVLMAVAPAYRPAAQPSGEAPPGR